MKEGTKTGLEVAARALGIHKKQTMVGRNIEESYNKKELYKCLEEAQFLGGGAELKDWDLCMKGNTDEIQNNISK
jgi:hypothetical protein